MRVTSYDVLKSELQGIFDFDDPQFDFTMAEPIGDIIDNGDAKISQNVMGQSVSTYRERWDRPSIGFEESRLESTEANKNVVILDLGSHHGKMLAGLSGSERYVDRIGKGMFTILFDEDQYAVGFRFYALPSPRMNFQNSTVTAVFYSRGGKIVDIVRWDVNGEVKIGYERTSLVNDIAAISVYNQHPNGVFVDDIIYKKAGLFS